jgi:hypothetical protein
MKELSDIGPHVDEGDVWRLQDRAARPDPAGPHTNGLISNRENLRTYRRGTHASFEGRACD